MAAAAAFATDSEEPEGTESADEDCALPRTSTNATRCTGSPTRAPVTDHFRMSLAQGLGGWAAGPQILVAAGPRPPEQQTSSPGVARPWSSSAWRSPVVPRAGSPAEGLCGGWCVGEVAGEPSGPDEVAAATGLHLPVERCMLKPTELAAHQHVRMAAISACMRCFGQDFSVAALPSPDSVTVRSFAPAYGATASPTRPACARGVAICRTADGPRARPQSVRPRTAPVSHPPHAWFCRGPAPTPGRPLRVTAHCPPVAASGTPSARSTGIPRWNCSPAMAPPASSRRSRRRASRHRRGTTG
ncbi:hypothetical protein GPN2_13104 [Streptomyces murinus]